MSFFERIKAAGKRVFILRKKTPNKQVNRVITLVTVGMALILLGAYGFHEYFEATGTSRTWLDCLYQSFQLIPIASGAVPPSLPWQLELARFLLPALTAYAFIGVLWVLIRDRYRSSTLDRIRNHVIVCGLGSKGRYLAQAYRKKFQVIVIEKESNDVGAESLHLGDNPIHIQKGDARDEGILIKAGLTRARHVFATCGQDGTNAAISEKVSHLLNTNLSNGNVTTDCKIHVTDHKLWTLLREHEFNNHKGDQNDCSKRYHMGFFNIPETGARFIVTELRKQGLLQINRKETPTLNLGIVGVGYLGQLIILHTARAWCSSYRLHGEKIRISLWDANAKEIAALLCKKYPIVHEVCQINAYEIDMKDPFFDKVWLSHNDKEAYVYRMYVCADDPNANLRVALEALQAFRTFPVIITLVMLEGGGLMPLMNNHKLTGGKAQLSAISLLEKACDPEALDDGTHQSLAQEIHGVWLEKERKKGLTQEDNPNIVEWEELGEQTRDQNRRQALGIGNNLFEIGLGIAPWTEYGAEKFKFSKEEIERMAKLEHDQWKNQLEREGWSSGPITDKGNKIHSSLVHWDQLSVEEQDKNRLTIKNFPDYLARAGFQIYRIK